MSTAFLKQIGISQQVAPLPISSSEVTIGRDRGCQLVLDSVSYTMVSRRHASIRPMTQLNSFEICDLGSANGTFVNGQRIVGCQRLFSGDRLTFGNNGPEFLFEDSSIPPTAVDNSPAYAAASPQFVGSNQVNPYPTYSPNQGRGRGQILGIVAVIVVGGLALQYLMQKTNSSSSPQATPSSTASSPGENPPGSSPATTDSPGSSPGTAEFGDTRACASTPSTRGQLCSRDSTTFPANSTQEIDIFAAVKNAPPSTNFSAVLTYQGARGTRSTNLGSGPLQSNIAFVYLTSSAQGFPIGNYDLVLSLDGTNTQPIHKTFAVN